MSKKRQTHLNNMVMFSLCRTILLVGMRARNMMIYTYALEERVQSLILSSPISLHCQNFAIELPFHKMLKIMKT
jgi:hypothetical protein